MRNWQIDTTGQTCIRVPDEVAWQGRWLSLSLPNISIPFKSDKLKIRAFAFDEPEGYQVEIQESAPGRLIQN